METLPVSDHSEDGAGKAGRWTTDEHQLFLQAFYKYGKNWKKLGSIITTRCILQIRTLIQKYLLKLQRALHMPDKVLTPEQKALLEMHMVFSILSKKIIFNYLTKYYFF